jgi:hypothetical protein
MRYRLLILLVLLPLLSPCAQAGILFGRKKEKPDPKQRVPELVATLKSDKDSDKRSRAAEELRTYDPAQFPEIIPALIDALQNDPKPGVRIDALQSLSRLRPVTQDAGEALEQALAKDSSMRVRLQARSALLQYHWAGYRSKKPEVPPLNPTRDPGRTPSDKYPPAIDTTMTPTSGRIPSSPYNSRPQVPNVTTKEPPLAPPLVPPAQLNPAPPPLQPPAKPMPPAPAPSNKPPSKEEGPELGPQLP